MLVFSHRGFHLNAPENTLEAFRAAINLGVDGIETDVRLTCDQVPILYHNPQTPDGVSLSQQTQAEISQAVGYAVPSLTEAIALTQGKGADFCWNLELKTRESFAIADRTIAALDVQTSILLTSFWHDGIAAMVAQPPEAIAHPTYRYGLLWACHPVRFEQPQWFETYPTLTALVFNQERLSQALVDHCHHKGRQILAYSDRTPEDLARLKHWGVDGVITDYPHRWLHT